MKFWLLFVLSSALLMAGCAPAVSGAKRAGEQPPATETDVREQYGASAKSDNMTFLDTLNRGKELALAESDVPKLEVVPTLEFAAVQPAQMASSTISPAPEQRFRIQILASSQIDMVRREKLNAESVMSLPIVMISEQSLYKLYAGDFRTREEAEAALPEIRNKGYKDAWIVSAVRQ